MRVEILGTKGTWREVANSANTTVGLEAGEKEPSSKWKKRILLCEHSPIRQLQVKAKWYDLLWWVQTHFTRHKFGVEWWVKTSRTDRGGSDRTEEGSQSNLIEVEAELNAQAVINISRKRLCFGCPSKETREAWKEFIDSLENRELASVCVPECLYRGFCPEFKCCGYVDTKEYEEALTLYRNVNWVE